MLTRTVKGHAIREVREREGLRVKDVVTALADDGLTVTKWHLYQVENGRAQPSARLLVGIAKVLDVDQDELFTDATDAA